MEIIINVRLLALIWLLCCLSIQAATYYVATTGNDSNDGSVGSPWLTIGKAVTNMVAGDTTIVNAGIYNTAHHPSFTQSDGTSNSPIHLKAATAGTVTNQGNFDIYHDWWIIDGLIFTALNTDNTCCYIHPVADYLVFTNNLVIQANAQGPVMETHYDPYTGPKYCIIISNRFINLTDGGGSEGVACAQLMGIGHTVKGNTMLNIVDLDIFRPFGSNHIITGNIISNVSEVNPSSHPDIIQLFGNDGGWGLGGYGNTILFERNTIQNAAVQFCQLEQNGVQLGSNLIVINNLFLDSNLQASINYGGLRFYNNTWLRCNQGIESLFSVWFYGSNWWYYTNYAAIIEGDQKPRGLGYGFDMRNNVMIDCSTDDYVYNQVLPAYWDGDSWEVDYGLAMDPDPKHYPEYNYVCWTNYTAKVGGFNETNGINGGTPVYVDLTNFVVNTDSLLYQAGTPIGLVTNDYYGRPRLNPPSIGAFEHQPISQPTIGIMPVTLIIP